MKSRQSAVAGHDHSGTTRESLLTAAADLMVGRGGVDISLSDIAQQSGLNAGLVRYYFGTKAGMMLALFRRAVSPSLAQLQELVAMPIGAEHKICLHIRGLVSTYERHPYLNRLLHAMLSNETDVFGATLAEELIRPVAAAQKAILDQGVAEGVFLPVDPMLFYFHVNGACEALFYSKSALSHGFGVAAIGRELKAAYVDYLSDTLLSGILAGPASADARRARRGRAAAPGRIYRAG